MKGQISMDLQIINALAIASSDGCDAAARGRHEARCRLPQRHGPDRLEELVTLSGHFLQRCLRQKHRELVAGQPCHPTGFVDCCADHSRHGEQQRIAAPVPLRPGLLPLDLEPDRRRMSREVRAPWSTHGLDLNDQAGAVRDGPHLPCTGHCDQAPDVLALDVERRVS